MGRSVAPVRSLLATARVRPESCRPWLSITAPGSTQSADPPAVPVLQRAACTAPDRPDAGATPWWSDRPIEPETSHHDARVCRQRRRAEYSRRPGAHRPAGWRDWPGVALSAWSWLGLLSSGRGLPALVELRGQPGVHHGSDRSRPGPPVVLSCPRPPALRPRLCGGTTSNVSHAPCSNVVSNVPCTAPQWPRADDSDEA